VNPEASSNDAPLSDSTSPAESAVPDAADLERRSFLKSVGRGAKYAAPTLTVLTFSRESLGQGYPSPPPFDPLYYYYKKK
jgi:hypothetical protein